MTHVSAADDLRRPQPTSGSTAEDVRGTSKDSRIRRGRYERSLNRLTYPPQTMREEPQVTHGSSADDVRGGLTDSRIHRGRPEKTSADFRVHRGRCERNLK